MLQGQPTIQTLSLRFWDWHKNVCTKVYYARVQKSDFLMFRYISKSVQNKKPEDHWSCIAHLIAEDMLKSAVIEEKKFKNIECK